MHDDEVVITDADDVVGVLTDARFAVPAATSGPPLTLAWLRGHVARFCDGAAHARRRAVVDELLRGLDVDALGRSAADMAAGYGDVRRVPVRALAVALGALGDVDAIVDAVFTIAAAYQPGASPELVTRADRAVSTVAPALTGEPDEVLANRIGLLVQTAVATATLVDNMLASGSRSIDEVLVHDPPVRATRRVASEDVRVGTIDVAAGTTVALQLGGDLAFGAGAHRCPGERHARALATAIVASAS